MVLQYARLGWVGLVPSLHTLSVLINFFLYVNHSGYRLFRFNICIVWLQSLVEIKLYLINKVFRGLALLSRGSCKCTLSSQNSPRQNYVDDWDGVGMVIMYLGIFMWGCRSVLLVSSISGTMVVVINFSLLLVLFCFCATQLFWSYIFALRSWYMTCEHYRFMLENITLNRCILVLVYRDT